MRYGRQKKYIALLTALFVCGLVSRGWASQLLSVAVGAQDSPLGGNTVALPLNPASALFHNPAQLSLLPHSFTVGALGVPFQPRYEHPIGYDETSRELPIVPVLGYVMHPRERLSFGIGMYGSLGFAYNFDADPQKGIPNNFYNELSVASLAAGMAYSVSDNLHIGLALNPSYGRLRLKTPSPAGRIDLDVRGPGIFGTLGVLYTPKAIPGLRLGIGYKTPGKVWMFGNARVGGQGDDATVYFHIPQSIEFGAAYDITQKLTVVAQGRWTQFSVFEDTKFRFDRHTGLNRRAVGDARDRFRFGAGLQYQVFPKVIARVGFSSERWAIAASSLSPALPDNTDFLFGFGLGIIQGPWQVDLTGGLSHMDDRKVSVEENPFFPGRYSLDLSLFGIQVSYNFDKKKDEEF